MGWNKISNLNSELIPVGQSEVAEELAVGSTAVQAATVSGKATHVLISFKTNAVLVSFDGVDPNPTGSVGVHYAVGERDIWPLSRLSSATFIEAVAATAGAVRIEPMVFIGG